MDYDKDIRIDEKNLDVEWCEQSTLALKYSKYWAECKKTLLAAEERIKVVKAELIKEANEDPEKCCSKEKPNGADIEAYYRNDRRHKDAKAAWMNAQYEFDMAEIAKNEICFTRKAALEQLVKLFLGNYFSGPKMPRDLTEERQKKANEMVGSMTRRKF
jgi:hypothetical protein